MTIGVIVARIAAFGTLPIDAEIVRVDQAALTESLPDSHPKITFIDVEQPIISLAIEGCKYPLRDFFMITCGTGMHHNDALNKFAPLIAGLSPRQELVLSHGDTGCAQHMHF